ncbi:MAG: ATP-binding cassette domain-containing protein [Deltaproteobacteria bacterium]|nr:ATP-binding cassette domain-containing protein [Deltaproteobacteria bacterium]
MNHAIEVKNLSKYYGKFLAVDKINFSVEKGEIFGFLGPNGAGKTTTQRMLTSLLTPSDGQIRVLGHDLAHDAYPAKGQIGLVPEESNVYTELTAWDNLMFTGRLYRMSKEDRNSRAEELLKIFGLWEKKDVKVENFSKGMRRRLSIAMAIIHTPALLFLDEPTPGLDAQSARAIQSIIRQLSAEGTTVFMTTHQIEEANQLCDRVAIIDQGKIAAIDTPEKLKQTFQQVQSVEISFTKSPNGLEEKLTALPEVSTVLKVGDKWRLYNDSPPALFPILMKFAENENIGILSLNTLAPSLEDVFLQITGQQVGTIQPASASPKKKRRKGGKK